MRAGVMALVSLGILVAGARASAQVTVTPPPPAPAQAAPAQAAAEQAEAPAAEAPTTPDATPAAAPLSGYDPDAGFVLRSPDKQYKLRIGLQAAYKFEPVWVNGDRLTRGQFNFLRPIVAGTLYRDWIRFWTSMELASNPPFVLDSFLEVQPTDAIGLRAGQFYTPISRHEQFGPQQLLFPEFAPVADYFWPGRDKGVMAFGMPLDGKVEYYAGVFGGSPLRSFRTISGNYQVMARVAVNPLGPPGATEYPYIVPRGAAPAPFRLSFALQGWKSRVQQGAENFNPSTFRFDFTPTDQVTKHLGGAVDMFVQGSWFAFLAEGYVRRSEILGAPRFTGIGAFGQLGVLVIPHLLDIAARFSWLNPSTQLSDDKFWSIEAQTALYIHAPQLVLKLRYGYGRQSSPGEEALGVVPLPVANVGNLHIASLQMNVMF